MTQQGDNELLTTSELAELLGFSRSSMCRWVRDGAIAPDLTTPGGHARFRRTSVSLIRAQLRALGERRAQRPGRAA